jgi:hypothetical protein
MKGLIKFSLLVIALAISVNGKIWSKSGLPKCNLKEDFLEQNSEFTGPRTGNIFIVYMVGADVNKFREHAKQMARLKPFGRVDMMVNSPAFKGSFGKHPAISGWHEYASYNMTVGAFFPDERMTPFIPVHLIEKNRELLFSKVEVLREFGLYAAFRSNEPRYLPEIFYQSYPHLRGPRVDHPRRSTQMAFAPCFHQPETVEMYHSMVNQLFTHVPEIRTFYFSMNDAGSGNCWYDWLYTGPNGPMGCKHIDKSTSIVNMLDIFKNGAKLTGHDVDIYFTGMFTDEERDDLVAKLPDNTFLQGRNIPPLKNVSGRLNSYPVRGIINPIRIIGSMSSADKEPGRYLLSFLGGYSRAEELIETTEKIVDIIVDNFVTPAGEGESDILDALSRLCVKWAGPENADILYNAFIELDQTISENATNLRALGTTYWGVSTRHITRPLVFAPQRLTPEEEKYFLPHVFNVSIEEARNDYMDIHGGNRELPMNAVDNMVQGLERVGTAMETIQNAPEQKFLNDMAIALQLYSCVLRSCGNFNDAQIIRNRNIERLAGEPRYPSKIPTWTGDQDLLDFNEIMRNELDNTLDMINLLENGGMKMVCTAEGPFPEDTFFLGSDLIEQLKKKRKIMLDHWRDIEGYLSTPFK